MSQLQLVPIRRLIDDVVQHGRRHWRQILPSVALVQFGMGLLALLLQEPQLALAASPNPSGEELMAFFGLLFPLLFLIFAIVIVAFSAVMVAAMDGLEGRPIDMKRAWGFSLSPKVFLTNGLTYVLVMLSAMCCFLPVLYVGPILAFVLPIMVHQGVFGGTAIKRSVELAKYNPTGRFQDYAWLHMLGVLVAGTLVSYALSFVAQLPLMIVQVVMTVRQAAGGLLDTPVVPPMWLQVPTQAAVAVVTTASWIYWSFAICALYLEILRRRDGGDLQSAIDGMTGGGAPPRANPYAPPPPGANPYAPPPSNPYAPPSPPAAAPAAPPVPPSGPVEPDPSPGSGGDGATGEDTPRSDQG